MFKAIAGFLVILGLVVMGFAITMDVTVDVPGQFNKRVFNLHLASQQTNALMVGGLLFISGIVMLVASRRKSNHTEIQSSSTEVKVGPMSTTLGRWRTKSKETKLILIGSTFAFISTFINWTDHYLSTLKVGGDHISIMSLAVLVGCWSLPLYIVFKGLPMTRKQLVIPATILVLWILKEIMFANDFGIVSVSIGLGMWMALISGCLLAWTGITLKVNQKAVS